ncbi:MAG: uroporphyrinogen decarboxylase family protein [Promethearchaeota archaeon]
MALLDFLPFYISCRMSFATAYYHAHAGTCYDQEHMLDPVKRHEQEVKAWEYRVNKYPEFFEHEKNSKPRPYLGVGVPTNPKIFGCTVHYRPHMDAHALTYLGEGENPMSLKVPDIQANMQWLYEEIDALVDRGWKKEEIRLPDLQGPLNTSMKLVGDNRMLKLIAQRKKEEVVRHILDVASDLYTEVYTSLRKATGRPEKSPWTASGCTYYYLSPFHFKKFIIPVIEKCKESMGNIVALHHCGVAPTKKIEAYAEFPWREVTLGFGSDYELARKLFIHPNLGPIVINCRISPFRMLNQTAQQIKEDVARITSGIKGGPGNIHLVGCPNNTPEENLWALWNAVKAYNDKKAEEEMAE